jgi:hypothetical protein
VRWRELADPVARRIPAGPRDGIDIGVAQEWRLRIDDAPTDFRQVVRAITGDLPHRDPGDPNAVRLPSGVGLTADGWEAELVTPPVPLGPGSPELIGELLADGLADLSKRLLQNGYAPGFSGFSTHVHVTCPDQHVVRAAELLAWRCAPAMALLLESSDSAGLLIRPRRGRLEIGSDHLDGPLLEVALTAVPAIVLLGAASAERRGVRGKRSVRSLPELDLAIVPARDRFGHYVDRRASGTDLYTAGRAAVLRTSKGSTITAADHLSAVWQRARPYAQRLGLDPVPVDEVVAARSMLPCEVADRSDEPAAVAALGRPRPPARPEIPDLRRRRRPFGVVEAAWVTWNVTGWRCSGPDGGEYFLVIPRADNAGFLTVLDAGRLDRPLARRLRRAR